MRQALLLAAVASAAATSASAATPTRAGWAHGANRACRVELDRLHALQRPGQGDYAGLAAYLQNMVAIATPLTKQIAVLPRPTAERGLIARWIALQWQGVAVSRQLRAAVLARDGAKLQSGLVAMARVASRSDTIATQLGANVCAES